MNATQTHDYIEVIEYLRRELEPRFAERVRLARVLAGEPSWKDVAEAMSQVSGEDYTRDVLANVTSRKADSPHRGRVTVDKVDAIVETFADHYGLCYQDANGKPGDPVDRDWFLTEHPRMLTRHFPGYPTSLSDLVPAA